MENDEFDDDEYDKYVSPSFESYHEAWKQMDTTGWHPGFHSWYHHDKPNWIRIIKPVAGTGKFVIIEKRPKNEP